MRGTETATSLNAEVPPTSFDRALRFVARRILFYLVAAWAAITLNFFIPRLMPGNPVDGVFARLKVQASPAKLRSFEVAFGVDTHQSLIAQYLRYLRDLSCGDLGLSITYFPSSVATVIRTALPWTVVLLGIATVVSFVVGTFLGILSAWRRGTALADAIVPVASVLSAVPYFWLGLIVLMIFGAELGWLPLSGGSAPGTQSGFNWPFISSAVSHGVLPAGTVVASSIAAWILNMRNSMSAVMGEDYVVVAEAKGLSPRRVMFVYAARNAMLPNMASFALSLGFVVGGALLTEIVFSYPGIGNVLFQAVSNEDYPLIQGVFLVITIMVLLANLLADIGYALLDPRTRRPAP